MGLSTPVSLIISFSFSSCPVLLIIGLSCAFVFLSVILSLPVIFLAELSSALFLIDRSSSLFLLGPLSSFSSFSSSHSPKGGSLSLSWVLNALTNVYLLPFCSGVGTSSSLSVSA